MVVVLRGYYIVSERLRCDILEMRMILKCLKWRMLLPIPLDHEPN
jgi:hypothetical protein